MALEIRVGIDPFGKVRCCKTFASMYEEATADFYLSLGSDVDSLLSELYSNEMFGKDTEDMYNRMNDIHYLFFLMTLAHFERKQDADKQLYLSDVSGCDQDLGQEFYIDKYNIECVQKHFLCSGMNIDAALEAFTMNPNLLEGVGGIGSMSIGNGNTNCEGILPYFEISDL